MSVITSSGIFLTASHKSASLSAKCLTASMSFKFAFLARETAFSLMSLWASPLYPAICKAIYNGSAKMTLAAHFEVTAQIRFINRQAGKKGGSLVILSQKRTKLLNQIHDDNREIPIHTARHQIALMFAH